MLHPREREDGYALLKEVIHQATADHNATTAEGDFHVAATVDGEVVFSGKARCYFQIDHYEGSMSIYWEESGLPQYKEAGLYGRMSTKFQKVRRHPGGTLEILGTDSGYLIHINYMSK